jgi:hypothetical protein
MIGPVPPLDYPERYARPIAPRDLEAVFIPRGRRCYLVPANDTGEPDAAVGGKLGLVVMLAVAMWLGIALAVMS